MRRRQIVIPIGIIILFIGIIFFFYSDVPNQTVQIKNWTVYGFQENSWEFSGNFTAGDLIKVEIQPATNWANFLDYDYYLQYSYHPAFLNISNSLGNKAMFYCEFVPVGNRLYLFKVEITESSGLLVGVNATLAEEKGMIFRVIINGTHTARVSSPGDPPEAITFFKGEEMITTEYPYSDFLYPSIVMLAAGATLTFYAIMVSREQRRLRRRKV